MNERCLRIAPGDKQSSFEKPLKKYSSFAIHEKKTQTLATEMYKVGKGMWPPQIFERIWTKNWTPLQFNI